MKNIKKHTLFALVIISLASCKKQVNAPSDIYPQAEVSEIQNEEINASSLQRNDLTAASLTQVKNLLTTGIWISPSGGKCFFYNGKYQTVVRASDLPANSTVGLQQNYSLTQEQIISYPKLILPGTGYGAVVKTIINIISSAFPQNNARVFVLRIGSTHKFVIKSISYSSMSLVRITASQIGNYPTTSFIK